MEAYVAPCNKWLACLTVYVIDVAVVLILVAAAAVAVTFICFSICSDH